MSSRSSTGRAGSRGGADRAPTVVEVARAAGVSVGTVSNVLTGAKQVSPETRASVERAITELGYLHNGVAASLRARSSQTICLIVPDIASPVWGELARGATDVLRDNGYATVLCNSDGDPELQRQDLHDALRRRLDGALIAASALPDDDLPEPASLPAVTVTGAATATADHIDGGDEYGGGLAAALLRQLGHTELVVVAGPSVPERARTDGFVRNASATGPVPAILDGRALLAAPGELLGRLGAATAAFCTSDALAGQLAGAVRRRGGRVPEQFSVIGYGGGARADAVATDLTSVVPPSYALGASAARLLLHRIRHPAEAPQTVALRPQLREGRTAARGPSRSGRPDPRRLGLRQTIHQLDYEFPGRGQELVLELAERFAATGTGDQVELSFDVRGPLDYERRLGEALAAGGGAAPGGAAPGGAAGSGAAPGEKTVAPDLFHDNGGYLTAALVGDGRVLPLTEFADALGWDRRLSPQLLREGRYAPDGLRWGDADAPLYCVSYYAEIMGLFVDPVTLERVGVAVPRTLDELEGALAAAQGAGIDGLAFGDDDGIAGVHLLEALLTRLLDADALRRRRLRPRRQPRSRQHPRGAGDDRALGRARLPLTRSPAARASRGLAAVRRRRGAVPAHRRLRPGRARGRLRPAAALRAGARARCRRLAARRRQRRRRARNRRGHGLSGPRRPLAGLPAGAAAAAVVESHGLISLTQPHSGSQDGGRQRDPRPAGAGRTRLLPERRLADDALDDARRAGRRDRRRLQRRRGRAAAGRPARLAGAARRLGLNPF